MFAGLEWVAMLGLFNLIVLSLLVYIALKVRNLDK